MSTIFALQGPLLAADSSGGSGLSLIFLLLPVAMLVFLLVPQRKQRKQQQEFLSGLDVGDEVVTSGGIYGHINFIEEDTGIVHLEVDTDVVVRIAKSSLTRAVSAKPVGGAEGRDGAASTEPAVDGSSKSSKKK